ncbi:2'-5' RNA ligase family protein [Streptomyces sp. NPDC091280]|uniref:2'-5' RNA ligase family protein n=1 Tax=Streptomyces sp. NPDC091280 TaxID=3365984 RepID=UPI0037FF18E1
MHQVRYGVYLRPDARTCWNVTQITTALRHQFGLLSAGAFPPHATLVGNMKTDASVDELIAVLDPVFAETEPFTVYNPGVQHSPVGHAYNINRDESGDKPNVPLNALAQAVREAVLPLSIPTYEYLVPPVEEQEFEAHLSLASHELMVDNRRSGEIGEFIDELDWQPPASFTARWYTLFEFRADWDGYWWETLTWRHLQSWDTANTVSTVSTFKAAPIQRAAQA